MRATGQLLRAVRDVCPEQRHRWARFATRGLGGGSGVQESGARHAAAKSHHLPRTIAFNVIPQIGEFRDDGSTDEEWKMRVELQKILSPNIQVSVTCVRVPVFIGHSVAATVEFESPITRERG